MKEMSVVPDPLSAFRNNPPLFVLFTGAVIVVLVYSVQKYKQNTQRATKDEAKPGQYSGSSSYQNISSMKHDIFKQLTIDLLPRLLIYGIPTAILAAAGTSSGILGLQEVITFRSYVEFRNSILGGSILTALGYLLFYQMVQPDFVNKTPYF